MNEEIVSRRAIRRHHYERLKKKWNRRLLKRGEIENMQDGKKIVSKRVSTSTPYSCVLCGNPRRHFGTRTLREKKERREFMEQIMEIEEQFNMNV